MTSRVTSFRSTASSVDSSLLNRARTRAITSEARLPSRIVRLAVSRAPSTFGGSASSIRRQVLALVMMPESGWFTSCAIDAVKHAEARDPGDFASSDRAFPSASSDSRRAVTILNRTDVLQSTVLVSGPVSDHVQVLDRLVGHQQPVLTFKVVPAPRAALDYVIEQRDVFRVDPGSDQFGRHGHPGLKPENAVELF